MNHALRFRYLIEHPSQAITDAPCVIFSDELLSAYPDAKVILTNREVGSWLRSMDASYYRILSWRYWRILAVADRVRA